MMKRPIIGARLVQSIKGTPPVAHSEDNNSPFRNTSDSGSSSSKEWSKFQLERLLNRAIFPEEREKHIAHLKKWADEAQVSIKIIDVDLKSLTTTVTRYVPESDGE